MTLRQHDNFKQVLVSIFIGACVAFLTTLFQGLAEFIQTHGNDIFAGTVATAVYLAKAYRA